MEIKNPRRMLFLGGNDSGVLTLLQDLTGSAPFPSVFSPSLSSVSTTSSTAPPTAVPTTAGLTHNLHFKNAYYTATIPIWLDEPAETLEEWKNDFCSKQAGEVVRAIAAWVVVLRLNSTSEGKNQNPFDPLEAMAAIKSVIAVAYNGEINAWDGVLLAVGMPSSFVPSTPRQDAGDTKEAEQDWEDACWDLGFEYVDCSGSKTASMRVEQEYIGEIREKIGLERVLEALETNDWAGGDDEEVDEEEVGLFEHGEGEVGNLMLAEGEEFEREFMGMKFAVGGIGVGGLLHEEDETEEDIDEVEEALQVEEMERMMQKMMAVKDMSAHMPESERKRFAAKAVNDFMRST